MAFTLNGTEITQSGTDTDLSGLSGIAGVTVSTVGNYSSYNIADLIIKIQGTLTIDPRNNMLIGNARKMLTMDNGTLNIGTEYTVNGYTIQTPETAIINTSTPYPWAGAKYWLVNTRKWHS
jgi:hypothetical protein